MDLGSLISGLVSSSVHLMTRPFFFCISACVFCLRTALVTTFVTTDMVSSAILFNLSMFWRAVWGTIWGSVLLFTFPIRFFASVPREKLLEQSIYKLRYEVESLERNRKEIEENLRAAIKEYRIMERELEEAYFKKRIQCDARSRRWHSNVWSQRTRAVYSTHRSTLHCGWYLFEKCGSIFKSTLHRSTLHCAEATLIISD